MMHITRRRVMRSRNPCLPWTIIILEFGVRIDSVTAPATAKHTFTTSCAKYNDNKGKRKNSKIRKTIIAYEERSGED